jgi:3-carboxy-cis,cis-muconate cycloisomerase
VSGLLEPGAHRAAELTGDAVIVEAMLRVEVAWLRALASVGAATAEQAEVVAAAAAQWEPDLKLLAEISEESGNPVVALVVWLRDVIRDSTADRGSDSVAGQAAALVHRGLTSQDVLDTALMLIARAALHRMAADLTETASVLAELAARHRSTVMAGRTITQHAVPITFGLVAAQWLTAVLDVSDGVRRVDEALPVQCGGAAGTLSLAAELVDEPVVAARHLAGELALAAPDLPWHTRRRPITELADALVSVTDVLGLVAGQVLLLSRPEIGELSEGSPPGRGGSSTMPHKRNPVLAVLVRSAALQAPLLAAQMHLAAVEAMDQRPDGAWHTEWPSFRRLLELAVTATGQARELVTGLQVHDDVMQRRAALHVRSLLAERYGSADAVPPDAEPGDYLGATSVFVDAALARHGGTGEGGHE